jgi:hypothetical protein
LLGSSVSIPNWLTAKAIKKLAKELNVTASERFWKVFKDTAIMLTMGRSHSQAQILAAREERAQYSYKKDKQLDQLSNDNTNLEDKE